MTKQYILSSKEASLYSQDTLGGKAYNLAWLSRYKFQVPDWFVLTTEAFDLQIQLDKTATWIEAQLANLPSDKDGSQVFDKVARSIRERIIQNQLHTDLIKVLEEKLTAIEGGQTEYFAVRSSVVGEDASGASFAGQMDSFLFQKGLDAITDSVLKVFASAFNERALAYRITKGITLKNIRVAVVVQKMVAGQVSGVMFTAHPVTGSRKHALISACYGAGEGIVSGVCNTDEYTISLENQTVKKQISEKDIQLVLDTQAGKGLIQTNVKKQLRNQPCLKEEEIKALAQLGKQIAADKGAPQDIEWTLKNGKFYILQTRPITSMPAPAKPFGETVVWDNSNIQESYSGVTTPLTFSFASRAYALVYAQTMRVGGFSDHAIKKYQQTLDNLLGLIKGRVYYNINNWYRGLSLLPSFKTNKADMEKMMGLQDSVDFVQDRKLTFGEKIKKLPNILNAIFNLLTCFRKIDRLVAEFHVMFQHEYQRIDRQKLHTLEMAELMALTHQLNEGLLKKWTTPIVNDFYVMMKNGQVHRWLEKLKIDNPSLLLNNLLSGEAGIESTEPTKMLLRLCEVIRQKPALSKLFAETPNERLLAAVQVTDADFYQQCLIYIELYGDRVIGELKLESVSLRQDSAFMFGCLKNFLQRADLTPENLAKNEQQLRANAEQEISEQINNTLGKRKLKAFFKDLQKLRQAIKHRENMRLARTRLFGLYRDIYQEIGRQLAFYNILTEAEDIFYLTVTDLETYMEGRCVQANLKALTSTRKAEFAAYQQEDLPHHFSTIGPVYHHNCYEYKGKITETMMTENHLTGIGCYPGIVEQTIKLILSPDDELSLDGKILCTVRTDPGWAPLFPTAAGILVERGSTLSHSAVVARELGIPAIVGIPCLTKKLKNGEMVRMDGARGIIERLKFVR